MTWKLAFRNVLRHRTRSLISVLAIASGVISLILAGGFIADSIQFGKESYIREYLGHLRIYQKGYQRPDGLLNPFNYMISQPQKLIQELSGIPHIRYISPRLSFGALLSTGEASFSVGVDGMDPEIELAHGNTVKILEGNPLTKNEGLDVLLGKGPAAALGSHPGDSVVIMATTQRGSLNALDLSVKGTFATLNKAYDDRTIRLPLGVAQRILKTDQVQSLVIFLDTTDQTDKVKSAITSILKNQRQDYEVKAWYELEEADFVLKVTLFYRRIFGVLLAIIITVVTLSIANTMNMAVLERIGEIGTLSAMGTRPKGIISLFLIEGFFLGLLGGAMGSVVGCLLAVIISKIGIPMPTAPGTTLDWIARIAIVPEVVSMAFGIALVTSLLSSVLPAIKAAHLEIAEALRHNV